jgi:predicted ATPase/DNA-binding XRE family transcriptional regulator
MERGGVRTFGELLRGYRLFCGLSQEALAEQARMSASAIGALERGGRQAPYAQTVALLADALKLSATDRDAFEAAAARQRTRTPRALERPVPKSNLPLRFTLFVSRNEEIAAIEALLQTARLVTVTGSGGVGKTRTVLEVGDHLLAARQGDIWFVDLSPIHDGAQIPNAIAAVVGTEIADTTDPVADLARQLARHSFLLILDNCEHVIDDAAQVVTAILQQCPNVRILATSRERLALQAEHLYRLPSLPVPVATPASADEAFMYASFRLFMDRATAAGARLRATRDVLRAASEICRRLDGIPLAIELAATHVRTLGLPALSNGLNEHFSTLSGYRDLPARQQTMLATIHWSHDLLTREEQRLLRRLAVFRASFTLDAAEATCRASLLDGDILLDVLASLVDKSLVSATTLEPPARYRLLELVRAFSTEKLRDAGEVDLCARSHAVWVADFAERLARRRTELGLGPWVLQVTSEIDNVRAALDWALEQENDDDPLLGARILSAFCIYFYEQHDTEIRRWLDTAIARVDAGKHPRLTAELAYTNLMILEGSDVVTFGKQAMPLIERTLGPDAIYYSYIMLAMEQNRLGEVDDADGSVAKAFAFAEKSPTPERALAYVFETRCTLHMERHQVTEARKALDEVRRRVAAIDPGGGMIETLLSHEAQIECLEGNHARAITLLEARVDYLRAHSRTPATTLVQLCEALVLAGDLQGALSRLPQTIELRQTLRAHTAYDALRPAAAAAALGGEPCAAAVLLGFIETAKSRVNESLSIFDAAVADLLTSSLAALLPPEELEALKAIGATFEMDRAVDETLALVAKLQAKG